MEGWLYGLFTILGVLFGGLFTYLGLRKQLKHQKEINEIEWRRKVRSEPLFSLRNELANMATKQERIVIAAQGVQIKTSDTLQKELNQAFEDWSTHIQDYQGSLYIQYDVEIVKFVDEIMGNYQKSWIDTLENGNLSSKKLKNAIKILKKNNKKIIKVQELINKKLEEL